jgi:hypothetical protein
MVFLTSKPDATHEAYYIAYPNTWGLTSGGVVPTHGAGSPSGVDWSDGNSVESCLNQCTQSTNCTGIQVKTADSNTIQSNPLNDNKNLTASSIPAGICYATYNTGPVTSTNINQNTTTNSAWTLYAKKMT